MAPAPEGSLFNPDMLRQLLRRLEGSDVEELELTLGESRLYVRREPVEEEDGVWIPASTAAEEEAGSGVPLLAPLTGVYYSRPDPNQPPYVSPGDHVVAGQTVALIETMKLFNEVAAEVTGTVVSVVAEDGELIEVDQPILFVEPGTVDDTPPVTLM